MPLAFIMEVRFKSEETAFLKHFLVRVLKKKKKKKRNIRHWNKQGKENIFHQTHAGDVVCFSSVIV